MNWRHATVAASMAAAICCGVPPDTRKPWASSALRRPASASARFTSAARRSLTSAGVPGGATRPFQVGTGSVTTPASASEGTPGAAFMGAARQWNNAEFDDPALGHVQTVDLPIRDGSGDVNRSAIAALPTAELLRRLAIGAHAVRVPYKGGAQLMPDLISGELQFNLGPLAPALPHVRSGKLRLLATLPDRSDTTPGVPSRRATLPHASRRKSIGRWPSRRCAADWKRKASALPAARRRRWSRRWKRPPPRGASSCVTTTFRRSDAMRADLTASGPTFGMSRATYLAALGALFAVFNSVRVLAYMPTIWAVAASGDSSQHSLWTWLTFLGGNATMAVWLWEQNHRRVTGAALASAGNALMCAAIVAVIAWTRL